MASRLPTTRTRPTIGKRILFALAGSILALGCVAILAEGICRVSTPTEKRRKFIVHFREVLAGSNGGRFLPADGVGYRLNPSDPGVNALGFGGPLPPLERIPRIPRIAFVGGSTTRSGNPDEYEGSFPKFVGDELEKILRRKVEILNFGMSGWSTWPSLINLREIGLDFAPDLVVIHHAANDVTPRVAPGYRPDYSHYLKPWGWDPPHPGGQWLARWSDLYVWWLIHAGYVRGDVDDFTTRRFPPVQATYRPDTGFLEGTDRGYREHIVEMIRLCRERGIRVLLTTMSYQKTRPCPPVAHMLQDGIADLNRVMREIVREEEVPLADLALVPFPPREHAGGLVHKTPEGNRRIAGAIVQAILRRRLLDEVDGEALRRARTWGQRLREGG